MSSEALHNNSGSHSESCFQGPERQNEPPTNAHKTLTAGKEGGRKGGVGFHGKLTLFARLTRVIYS